MKAASLAAEANPADTPRPSAPRTSVAAAPTTPFPAAALDDSPLDSESAGVDLLGRLEGICARRGLIHLADRLEDMATFVALDLATFEHEFARLPKREELVGRSATHLLDLGGKRLRPLCLSLAARLGGGFDERVLDLAVAVELVHAATLLHDDVVDGSDARRGAQTARALYGNAASIFAGDWLLIEALRRVERAGAPGALVALFSTVEEMIFAESLQLEARGRLRADRDTYFAVVEGKTASLFGWAMVAGGTAGGLDPEACASLAAYGRDLGVSFQAIDDLLDLTGDAERTGKALFADLVEGKITLPLILALERRPALRTTVEEIVSAPPGTEVEPQLFEEVVATLRDTGAVQSCLELARERSARAVAALENLPAGRARRALETIALAIVDRDL